MSGERIVSIRHGLREGRAQGDLTYCELVGWFEGPGDFVRVNRQQTIELGGESHAHFQPMGTQGSLLQDVKSITNQQVVQSIYSPRCLLDNIFDFRQATQVFWQTPSRERSQ